MSKVKYIGAQAENDHHKSNGGDFVVFNREPSLTRQEFLEECDINTLMKKYDAHVIGGPGNLPARVPMYFDFADTPQDLLGYLEFIKDAEAQFMSLPAVVRKEFDNSAVDFVAFASDPENIDQMRSWGLAAPAPVMPPQDLAPKASPSGEAVPAGSSAAPAGASTQLPT